MNVSEPLWKGHSSTSSKALSPALLTRRMGSYTGYSSTHPVSLLSRATSLNSTNSSSSGTSNENISLSQNQTDSIIAAISTSGPHLFTFQTFLIVVFTITFATIVLPMIAGAIFRTILQWANHYKGHWRVLLLVLCVAVIIATRLAIPQEVLYAYIIIFAGPQIALAALLNFRTKLRIKRWIAYAAILVMSIYVDLASGDLRSVLFGDHTGHGFPGLTGILPVFYLFVLGTMNDMLLFFRRRTSKSGILSSYSAKAISILISGHRKSWAWGLASLWLVVHSLLCFIPSSLPTPLIFQMSYGTFFFLYGTGKQLTALKAHKDRSKWASFILAITVAWTCNTFITNGFLVSVVPPLCLILYKIIRNDQPFIAAYFPDWMNLGRNRTPPTVDGQNLA